MKVWHSKPLHLTVTYPEGPDPFPDDALTVECKDDPFLADMWLWKLKEARFYGHSVDKGGWFVPWELDAVVPSIFRGYGIDLNMQLIEGEALPVPELPIGAVP